MAKTVEELKIELEEAYKIAEPKGKAAYDAPDVWEFQRLREEAYADFNRIQTEIDMLREPKMGPIADYGNHMPMQEFIDCCECGGFIDYDGSGNYATETEESDISISPSDVARGDIRKDFTHVVWYNR